MNTVVRETIHKAARRLKTTLWLVGGPIRDELLGRPCDDWDMVCRHARKVAEQVSRKLRAKLITLDEQHKIYRVIVASPGKPPSPDGRGTSAAQGEAKITLDFAELQGRTIEEDLARRDFTINAMAIPLSSFPAVSGGESIKPLKTMMDPGLRPAGMTFLIDPFKGQRDLKRKLIRAVSERAFSEDPLRLVRAFRFASQFEFRIDPRTLRWIKKHRDGLSKVAAERIREELLKLWKQPRSGTALRLMDRVRLLANIFPEIEACRRTAIRYYGKGGVLKHSLETVENLEWILQLIERGSEGVREREKTRTFPSLLRSFTPSLQQYLQGTVGGYPRTAWLKWAAFLHDVGKPATAKVIKGRLRFFEHEHVGATLAMRIGQRLRCSRQEVQLLGLWVRNHMRPGNLAATARLTDKALSRFFRDLGEDGVGMVLVSLADHYTYLARSRWGKGQDPVEKISRRLITSYYEERSKILPARLVNGHDLMRKLKLKAGPMIGRLLEKIQDAQAEGKVRTKEEALAFAKRNFKWQI